MLSINSYLLFPAGLKKRKDTVVSLRFDDTFIVMVHWR